MSDSGPLNFLGGLGAVLNPIGLLSTGAATAAVATSLPAVATAGTALLADKELNDSKLTKKILGVGDQGNAVPGIPAGPTENDPSVIQAGRDTRRARGRAATYLTPQSASLNPSGSYFSRSLLGS